MSKLSPTQVNVLVEVNTTGTLPKGTRQATITKLREEGYLIITKIGEDTTYSLSGDGRKEIGLPVAPDHDNQSTPESVEGLVVPKFNRKMIRDLRRAQAKANRRGMRERGKRIKRYGVDDEGYFRRKAEKAYGEMVDQIRSEDKAA